jgi:hypothetical protein
MADPDIRWHVRPASPNSVRIVVTWNDHGQRGDLGATFDQPSARRLVEDICRCAGLPEPWAKG